MHFGRKGTGLVLEEGMFFTIEPMINTGTSETKEEKGIKLPKFAKMLNITSIVLGLTSVCVFVAAFWMFSQSKEASEGAVDLNQVVETPKETPKEKEIH